MKKKPINPKDLEVNREFLSEKKNDNSANSEASKDTGTLCITEIVCAPTEKNCPETQGVDGNCRPLTKQVGCVNTKNNCLTNDLCGDSNNLCQVSVNNCLQTRDNCAKTETCAIPATMLPGRCTKD